MPTLKIPTPLRPYAGGQATIEVNGASVREALADLVAQHPDLNQHIFNESGELRPFVNLFLNDEDVRYLNGADTSISESDLLRIIPSIAGGVDTSSFPNRNDAGSQQTLSENRRHVDHAALRTNQALIIGLNILGFVLNEPRLILVVTLLMLAGTVLRRPGFGFVYRLVLKPLGIVKADVIPDNPEPHRFAQGFGAVVMTAGSAALAAGAVTTGWGLVWLVTALAALNLFGGFCVGCAVYYWLNRLHVPGFVKAPPAGSVPGMRPRETDL
jgi:molybdopterin converting factor small subunit